MRCHESSLSHHNHVSNSIAAFHRRGSADSTGSDVEHTRACIDRLDQKVASLSDDVASLSNDVRTILHLLRQWPGNVGSSVDSRLDSPTDDSKGLDLSPTLQRANQHRDSIASAPGLSSGISIVGILKNGSSQSDKNLVPSGASGENSVKFVTSRSVDCVQLPLTTTSIQPAGDHSNVRLRSPLAPRTNTGRKPGKNGSRISPIGDKLESANSDARSNTGSQFSSSLSAHSDDGRGGDGRKCLSGNDAILTAGHDSLLSGQQKPVWSDDSGTDSPKGWTSRGMSSSTSGSGSGGSLPPATPSPLPPAAVATNAFHLSDSAGDMQAANQLQEFQDSAVSTTPDRSIPPSNHSPHSLLPDTSVAPSTCEDTQSLGDSDSMSESDSQASHTPFLSTEL